MAITTFDNYIAAAKQIFSFYKSTVVTTSAYIPISTIAMIGTPGAGVIPGTSTTQGVVPTSATAGFFPIIDTGNKLYLTRASYSLGGSTGVMTLYDLLYKAGGYPALSTTTITSPPSFSSRIPLVNGVPFNHTELWVECATTMTGSLGIDVTYTNQDNVSGRSTGTATTTAAFSITPGRLFRIPLQSGDTGVTSIQQVVTTSATGGSCNILIMRRLADISAIVASVTNQQNLVDTGMPEVFPTSAILPILLPFNTVSGYPQINFEIAG